MTDKLVCPHCDGTDVLKTSRLSWVCRSCKRSWRFVPEGVELAPSDPDDWIHPNYDWPIDQATRLRAALSGYDVQYDDVGIGEWHPELPQGCIDRVEAVVEAARALLVSTGVIAINDE